MTTTRSVLITSVLPIAGIAVLAGAYAFFDHRSGRSTLKPDLIQDPTALKDFLDRLQLLWDHYLDMLQNLITLITGVLAFSAGLVKFSGKGHVADRRFYAAGMASLLMALTLAILWRVDAQVLMEIEIFGDPSKTLGLYHAHGIGLPFTTSFRYVASLPWLGYLAKFFLFGTAYGFLAGLVFLARFAFSNLPTQTSPQHE